jgi:AcrR family transcriptional regulator
MEAAGKIFAENGYHATTVREIVQRAGLNIAAVNYYFGDKERLYVEAVRQAGRGCAERVPMPEWSPATPAAVKLRDFIHTFLSRVAVDHEPTWHGRLIMRELTQPTAACVAFVEEFVRRNFEILMAILGELLPADAPEVKRNMTAFSIIGQCLHYRFTRPVLRLLLGDEFKTYDVDRLTNHITEFSLAALGRKQDASATEVRS